MRCVPQSRNQGRIEAEPITIIAKHKIRVGWFPPGLLGRRPDQIGKWAPLSQRAIEGAEKGPVASDAANLLLQGGSRLALLDHPPVDEILYVLPRKGFDS